MIVLVCGPPCAGKTTYIRERAEPNDLVIDFDTIAQHLGSPVTHGHEYRIGRRAEAEVQRLLDEVASGIHPRAWISRTLPEGHKRKTLAARVQADEVVVLTEPRTVLLDRARSRRDPSATARVIDWWLAAYTDEQPSSTSALGFFGG